MNTEEKLMIQNRVSKTRQVQALISKAWDICDGDIGAFDTAMRHVAENVFDKVTDGRDLDLTRFDEEHNSLTIKVIDKYDPSIGTITGIKDGKLNTGYYLRTLDDLEPIDILDMCNILEDLYKMQDKLNK